MLEIRNLYAGYTKVNPILKGISLNIEYDEVVGILGRNGSGKSTLAKAICGLVPYIDGEILLDRQPLMGLSTYEIAKKGIGFFQQGGRIFPNLTLYENIAFAASSFTKDEVDERIMEFSKWFELLQKPNRMKLKASYLSGGEKHQLALAMILFQKPKLVILDEPSAGLSPVNQTTIYKALQRIIEIEKLTLLVIEQNVELAMTFCDRVVQLNNGVFLNQKEINQNIYN